MVDLYIYVADAAIGLRHASKKKEMQTKNTERFSAVQLEKKRYVARDFLTILVRASTADRATIREKTNPMTWNHIFQLQRQCRGA